MINYGVPKIKVEVTFRLSIFPTKSDNVEFLPMLYVMSLVAMWQCLL